MYVYNTWSLSFDSWRVCGFCQICQTVVASPICREKTQMSHVSNDSDHVLYLSCLKTGFLWRFPKIFH